MNQSDIKEPSKGFYIFVWFLNGIAGSLTVFAIDSGLAAVLFNNVDSINDIYFGIFLAVLIESVAALIVSIIIYSYFKDLKISKVMPYIYILWTIGVFRNYFEVASEFVDLDISTTPFGLAFVVSWLILVLGFRFYFRNKDNW